MTDSTHPPSEETSVESHPVADPAAQRSSDPPTSGAAPENPDDSSDGVEASPAPADGASKPSGGAGEWLLRRRELSEAREALAQGGDRSFALAQALLALEQGDRIVDPIEPLRAGSGAGLALELYVLALTWAVAAQPHAPPPTAPRDLAAQDGVLAASLAEGTEEEAARVRAALTEDFAARAARPAADLDRDARLVAKHARRLAEAAEAPRRRVDAIRLARVGRFAALALVLGGIVWGIVFAVGVALTPKDLAKGKPWRASSAWPTFNPDTHTCDGETTYILFHTKEEESPWYEVDLGEVKTVARVDVRNRSDGGLKDRAIPLVAEISLDAKSWKEVAKKTNSFDTWIATFAPVQARYVRLRATRRTFLHLERVSVR